MKRPLKALLVAAAIPVVAAAVLLAVRPAAAASLTRVTSFGSNPSNLNMYIYVPDRLATRPALLVAIHYCTGSASAMFNGSRDYVTAADQYGFIIIFPEATRGGQCFDVWSPAGLTRNGGSDNNGIISMVNYAKSTYNVDASRVFLTGYSSGAMMTNVMAAEYPDVFAAGSAFAGVPATCFATGSSTNTWNSQCSGGQITKTAQQWGDAARAMYPGYSGRYPRMQLLHGTADTTLNYVNFGEEIKQWTNLNGVSQTPVLTDSPVSGWTRTRYGSNSTQAPVEGISVSGVGHSLPVSGQIAYSIAFLGLNTTSPTTAPTTARTTAPTTAPTTARTTAPTTAPTTARTTAPTTAPTTAATTGPPGACTATYKLVNSWPGGFQAQVDVTASGSINGWTVKMTMPSGVTISSLWNGVNTGTSGAVSVKNAPYNANAPTNFGFVANGSSSPAPSGISCTSP